MSAIFIKGNLVSCQPHHHHHHHHHHHQVSSWKVKESGKCELTGENTLRRETVCFYRYVVAPGIAKVGSVFPRVWASIRESCRQKVYETVALHFKMLKNWQPRGTFGRWGRKNAHDTVTMRDDFRNNRKNWWSRCSAELFPFVNAALLHGLWSICCGAPAIRVAKLWQNALARMRAEKPLLCRIAAGGCQTPCNSCAKGSFGPS